MCCTTGQVMTAAATRKIPNTPSSGPNRRRTLAPATLSLVGFEDSGWGTSGCGAFGGAGAGPSGSASEVRTFSRVYARSSSNVGGTGGSKLEAGRRGAGGAGAGGGLEGPKLDAGRFRAGGSCLGAGGLQLTGRRRRLYRPWDASPPPR